MNIWLILILVLLIGIIIFAVGCATDSTLSLLQCGGTNLMNKISNLIGGFMQ